MSESFDFGDKLILGVLAFLGTVTAACVTWLGVRGKNRVEHTGVIQTGYKQLLDEFKQERKEWLLERADFRKRLLDCEASIAGLRQYNNSLQRILRAAGIEVPAPKEVVPVVILDDTLVAEATPTEGKD